MATDQATPIEPGDSAEPTAYISPTVDFLVLLAMAAVVSVVGTVVLLP